MNLIIIPSYEPTRNLLNLIDGLNALDIKDILVIDDGSKDEYQPIFLEASSKGCIVIHNAKNQGKGMSLKNGIKYAIDNIKDIDGFVTCDSDGQHLPNDIKKVSDSLKENNNKIILGVRDFSNPNVPKQNRFGNRFSSFYFKLVTGVKCPDTQTGLRGIPFQYGELALKVEGERFDYEMNFLTKVASYKMPFLFVPIETVYEEKNDKSHFRPLVDSVRIYRNPIRFALSSTLCAVVDIGLFYIISLLFDNNIYELVVLATIIARLVSGILNFVINKLWSFRSSDQTSKEIMKYLTLYFSQMLLSMGGVALLANTPIPLVVSKIIVDGLLFVGSYFIQHRWVFKDKSLLKEANSKKENNNGN